ncbi:hypothetical protein [Pseudonocardia abyssalis]|uniref:Uncharacterized protein n=1 Tax=Pseudonocardia abyssalis TaxID=2792008 RepID=A0ABS6UX36_9PSEU|nr:hypothetical protein [Pseudonocardia abyssalis]MBW0113797.1 hypothetical protein [Pseudonocardia abyssalis]MBW0136259.1 hypothetical protein [Pseudonocardia abyssalis]
MKTIPAQSTRTGPMHAVGDRVGWGPTPRSRRSYTARPDGRFMRGLRATCYVLTSLASLVFLALVVYGFVRFGQLQQVFPGAP